jgi:SAM-dependent methyltransferase
MNNDEAQNMNKAFWNEVAPIHERSYNTEKLRNKISHISQIEKDELYPINDKDLLHLQCHIGTDSISLALDGANVTAVDFSEKSIEIANNLNKEIGTNVNFIASNIYDLKDKLTNKYDIVFTSKGVLCWISDLNKWAEIISYFLKSGGTFYIIETHPMKFIFDDTVDNDLKITYSYFHSSEPKLWDDDYPDYSDNTYIPKNKTYEWTWSLSDIVNALINNGLQIEMFNEYDKLFYKGLPGMIMSNDGWWHLKDYKGKIPFTFSIRAKKL